MVKTYLKNEGIELSTRVEDKYTLEYVGEQFAKRPAQSILVANDVEGAVFVTVCGNIGLIGRGAGENVLGEAIKDVANRDNVADDDILVIITYDCVGGVCSITDVCYVDVMAVK